MLISGDSAGAVGARAHLDRLAARLRASNANVRPRDPIYGDKTAKYNTVQVEQRNAYLCADNTYLELNHIATPIFQAMDKMDPLLIDGFRDGGATATNAEFAQVLTDQLVALGNIHNTAIERANIGTVPGVAGRNCGIHVTWNDDDGFLGKKYRTGPTAPAYSYYELL